MPSQTPEVRWSGVECMKERTIYTQGKENGPTRIHIFSDQQGTLMKFLS